MGYPDEKNDSFTGFQREADDLSIAPPPYSSSSRFDITAPRSYDLKSTKMDWIYSGAYSLRISGTEDEVWSLRLHTTSLEVFRADGSAIGSASLRCWSTKIEISMNDGNDHRDAEPTFTLKRNKGIFSESKCFIVPETGEKLVWKRASKLSGKFELVDPAGSVVAWIGPTSWKGKFKFELLRGGMGESVVESVVVTALAMAENEKRNTWGATNAASANSAAVAVAVSV